MSEDNRVSFPDMDTKEAAKAVQAKVELVMSMNLKAFAALVAAAERELVVRECIDIAQDRAAFDWAEPNDVNHIISEIKKHFGVEE